MPRPHVLLVGLVLLAFILRVATYQAPYFFGTDSFHHYRIAEHLATTGEMPVIWPLTNPAGGGGTGITKPAWFYWIAVGFYRLLELFGLSFFQAFKLVPAVFGALSVIPVYLIAKRVFDEEAALCSAVIVTVLPAAVLRTLAGYYRMDVFLMFSFLCAAYVFVRLASRGNLPLVVPMVVGALFFLLPPVNLVGYDNPVLRWVSELQPPSAVMLWVLFGLVLPLALYGVYVVARHRQGGLQGLVLVWAGTSLFLLALSIRWSFMAAYPLAILAGVGIASLPGRLPKAVILVGLVATGGAFAFGQPGTLTDGWKEALEFLGQQERGIVLSWWDAGSWVQGVTGFPTVVDSVHGQKREHVEAVAQAFLSANASNVSGFLQQYGVRYIVVSEDRAEHPGAVQSAAYQPEGALPTDSFLYSLAYLGGEGFPVRRVWDRDGVLIYLHEIKFS